MEEATAVMIGTVKGLRFLDLADHTGYVQRRVWRVLTWPINWLRLWPFRMWLCLLQGAFPWNIKTIMWILLRELQTRSCILCCAVTCLKLNWATVARFQFWHHHLLHVTQFSPDCCLWKKDATIIWLLFCDHSKDEVSKGSGYMKLSSFILG